MSLNATAEPFPTQSCKKLLKLASIKHTLLAPPAAEFHRQKKQWHDPQGIMDGIFLSRSSGTKALFYLSLTGNQKVNETLWAWLYSSSEMVMMIRAHRCHRIVRCRITDDSEKEETVRPKAWNTDTEKRQENEWTQNIDFCLGNSLRFSTKGLCWVWGALQGLDALCYSMGFIMVVVSWVSDGAKPWP